MRTIATLRDPADIDFPFYVTAHEMAHQWWGHQVRAPFVQGTQIVTETLAQYSALMVMEDYCGEAMMRRFLRYELEVYLTGRGSELIEELPLMYAEEQPYLHYRKGSVVMYALEDSIGEDRVNLALRRFVAEHAGAGPPFPTSRARKLEADGQGEETEAPLSAWLDVGVFPAPESRLGESDLPPPLYLEKHLISNGEQRIVVRVDSEPDRVGLDPYNKMIDRAPDDNSRRL